MKLQLSIDSKPLHIEIDDVVAGLLAARLGLPPFIEHCDGVIDTLAPRVVLTATPTGAVYFDAAAITQRWESALDKLAAAAE